MRTRRRVVVIENEVGAISIDHELIDEAAQARAPAGVRVLKNGCMCCAGETPGSELERVLDQLLVQEFGSLVPSQALPGKRAFGNLQPQFVEERKAALARYLQLCI